MNSSDFSHLVEIDGSTQVLRIHRVFPDGSKHLFTETTLPTGASPGDSTFDAFSRLLGENIILDSPVAQRLMITRPSDN